MTGGLFDYRMGLSNMPCIFPLISRGVVSLLYVCTKKKKCPVTFAQWMSRLRNSKKVKS
ncbi:hypothetical protein FA95DRAFT_705257 [Auriscalpium vulgare]|uniref:Uncharacterized protein n=1 Tax=Auriscalpium vulgare TaxID=40419 RepID=A0ACB8S0Y2_9AGAM|nr:hypothetical protein FA95DRAFT_705257 [Auriscalpium vulgare]